MGNGHIFQNERDIEIPEMLEFIDKNDGRYGSVLDVGCAYGQYTHELGLMCGSLDGVDILPDEKVRPYLDNFFHEDFLLVDLPKYDFVVSLSVIEHVGLEYLPSKLYKELQLEFFAKIVRLAQRGFWVSFPYGEGILYSGYFLNQNRAMLGGYEYLARGFKIKKQFYSTSDRRNPALWAEVGQEVADKAINDKAEGVSTICILSGIK